MAGAEPDPDGPEFLARLWAFIAAGASAPDPADAQHFACYLSGMVCGLFTELHMVAKSLSKDQAEEATAQLISHQLTVYESLAAQAASPENIPAAERA